jgi:uncharacterized protein YjiS (DUF1127 family)
MPSAKQLSYVSKSRIREPHQFDRHASRERSPGYDKALLSLPRQQTSRPVLSRAVSRLRAETVARFAAHAGSTFSHILLTVCSWLIAEFLAGCAVYAEAMYPTFTILEEDAGRGDPVPTAASQGTNTPASTRPRLRVISGKITHSIESDGQVSLSEQSRSRSAGPSCAEYGATTQPTPPSPLRWYVSISATVTCLLSKVREQQARRRAIFVLRTLDDRMLRDIGISRYDIESIGWREVWWR